MMLAAMTLLVTSVSCTKDGDTVYKPDPAEQQVSTAPLVIVIHNVEGVGDQSYNDLIYQGVEDAALQHGLRTLQLSPKTQREGLSYLEELFQQMSAASDTIRRLWSCLRRIHPQEQQPSGEQPSLQPALFGDQ